MILCIVGMSARISSHAMSHALLGNECTLSSQELVYAATVQQESNP